MTQQEGFRGDILIVDDVGENLEFLSAELAAQGYYVRPVNSGQLALMAARASAPDIVLLDILMPDMDGYDVCQAFKADRQIRDIPIIFVSGLDETIDKVRAFQLGAVDYITKPFQLEEVLARIDTHLTLYRQRRELEQQRELKARFVSIATHEFRTPLAVIKTAVDLLSRYYDRLSAQERAEELDTIDQEVKSLDKLIGEVLAFNKMDMGRLEFHPEVIDIKLFCERIAERFRRISDTPELVLKADEGPISACVDFNLLDHVLSNLLSNAFKYSPSGRHIYFQVSQDTDQVIFKVTDEGIGIPQEEQKHLFSPFYRASNAGRITGTGLGLAIVKQYVERHDGSVSFESRENAGTTFTVTVPRVQP